MSHTEIHQSHAPTVYSYCIFDATGKILEQRTEYCPAGDASARLVNRLLNRQEKYIKAIKVKNGKLIAILEEMRKKDAEEQIV